MFYCPSDTCFVRRFVLLFCFFLSVCLSGRKQSIWTPERQRSHAVKCPTFHATHAMSEETLVLQCVVPFPKALADRPLCPKCGRPQRSTCAFREHARKVHGTTKVDTTTICSACGKTFTQFKPASTHFSRCKARTNLQSTSVATYEPSTSEPPTYEPSTSEPPSSEPATSVPMTPQPTSTAVPPDASFAGSGTHPRLPGNSHSAQ